MRYGTPIFASILLLNWKIRSLFLFQVTSRCVLGGNIWLAPNHGVDMWDACRLGSCGGEKKKAIWRIPFFLPLGLAEYVLVIQQQILGFKSPLRDRDNSSHEEPERVSLPHESIGNACYLTRGENFLFSIVVGFNPPEVGPLDPHHYFIVSFLYLPWYDFRSSCCSWQFKVRFRPIMRTPIILKLFNCDRLIRNY